MFYALRAIEYAEFNLTQITQSYFAWLMPEECQKRLEKHNEPHIIDLCHDCSHQKDSSLDAHSPDLQFKKKIMTLAQKLKIIGGKTAVSHK